MEYIILTGASKGLGRALSKVLCSESAVLILIARDIEVLTKLKDELAKKSNAVYVYFLDLNDYKRVGEFIDKMFLEIKIDKNSRITFINNAGTIKPIKILVCYVRKKL